MGWLKCGAEWTLLVPGRASTLESELGEERNTHKHTRTHTIYPGSGPSCGGNTPTPAYLSLFRGISGYKVLLELLHTHQSLSIEELAFSLSKVELGENEELLGVVPRAGGGAGLYIALRHTGLLCHTVNCHLNTIPRYSKYHEHCAGELGSHVLHHRRGRVLSRDPDRTCAAVSCRLSPIGISSRGRR